MRSKSWKSTTNVLWPQRHWITSVTISKQSRITIQFLPNKLFLGCLRTVRFSDFLAETVFWELSFFIRNDSKLAFLEKNPLKHALFTLQHYPSSWQQLNAFRRRQHIGLKKFQKQTVFCNFWWKKKIRKTLFQPKSPWNRHVAFSLGKLWQEVQNVQDNFRKSLFPLCYELLTAKKVSIVVVNAHCHYHCVSKSCISFFQVLTRNLRQKSKTVKGNWISQNFSNSHIKRGPYLEKNPVRAVQSSGRKFCDVGRDLGREKIRWLKIPYFILKESKIYFTRETNFNS